VPFKPVMRSCIEAVAGQFPHEAGTRCEIEHFHMGEHGRSEVGHFTGFLAASGQPVTILATAWRAAQLHNDRYVRLHYSSQNWKE